MYKVNSYYSLKLVNFNTLSFADRKMTAVCLKLGFEKLKLEIIENCLKC